MLIKLTPEELFDVRAATLAAIDDNEASTLGCIRLTATAGGPRHWQATNSVIASVLLAGTSDDDVDMLLSPRLLPNNVSRDDQPILEIPDDRSGQSGRLLKLHLDGFSIAQAARQMNWPDLHEAISGCLGNEDVAVATFDRAVAIRAIERISVRPAGSDGTLNPPAYLDVEADLIRISVDWPGWGQSEVQIAAETRGNASFPVAPMRLRELLECASERVEFRVPIHDSQPLLAQAPDGSWYGLLKGLQVSPPPEQIMDRIHELLAEGFGLEGLEPDGDGDTPVPFEDEVVYLRAVDGRPPVVQAFTVVASVEQEDADLFRKINDLNTVVRWGRLFWVNGQVLCELDLDYYIDDDGLRNALHTIIDTTRMVRSLFSERTLSS